MKVGTGKKLSSRAAWLFSQVRKKIWFRSALFSLAAILTAAISALVGGLIPFDPSLSLASGSVDSILTVIASSMLAVTTFSLSIMVSAYASATSNVTPRSTKVLLADPTAQNTLSTFLGSFLFAIVGIIGLSAGLYDERGRVLLFFATLIVLAIITIALLRWIDQLGRFGRVGDTIRRVEHAALPALQSAARTPGLGTLPPGPVPADYLAIFAKRVGCITHIDVGKLDRLAAGQGCTVHLRALPGSLVHEGREVLSIPADVPADIAEQMRATITVDRSREFEQDPRFGLVVLAEIASRAMSPAVNDPGTAIDVLGSILRLFTDYSQAQDERDEPTCGNVTGPRLQIADLLQMVFDPISRDSSSNLEVVGRILFVLAALSKSSPTLFKLPAQKLACRAITIAADAEASTLFRADLHALAARHGFAFEISS